SLMLREGDLLKVMTTRGFAEPLRDQIEQLSFPLTADSVIEQIVQTHHPMVLADVQADPQFVRVPGTEHIHGWIGAPLLLEDEMIGLLTVDSSSVGAYDDADAQLAFTLVSQAAQAIRNARLFEQVR